MTITPKTELTPPATFATDMSTAAQTFHCNGCPVHVGMNVADATAALPERVVIITDENVERLHGGLTSGMQRIILPPGEQTKSLQTVEMVCKRLVEMEADRGTHLLAIGGGVVCDITGLVASLFMRGVSFTLMPTTLLAQVDAAIGGKTGVNSGPFKNLIGTFAQPDAVIGDPCFLDTLPDEELSNGLAECIKHACIADAPLFDWLEDNMTKLLGKDRQALNRLIATSVGVKVDIVNRDPREAGLRKLLNFGHTYGHAIEKHYDMAHGKAVSLGMCIANDMAVRHGHLSPVDARRIQDLLQRAGLPTNTASLDMTALQSLLIGDKKRNGNTLAFVLLNRIGDALIKPIPHP
jgi:3-dehydroquinate synthase